MPPRSHTHVLHSFVDPSILATECQRRDARSASTPQRIAVTTEEWIYYNLYLKRLPSPINEWTLPLSFSMKRFRATCENTNANINQLSVWDLGFEFLEASRNDWFSTKVLQLGLPLTLSVGRSPPTSIEQIRVCILEKSLGTMKVFSVSLSRNFHTSTTYSQRSSKKQKDDRPFMNEQIINDTQSDIPSGCKSNTKGYPNRRECKSSNRHENSSLCKSNFNSNFRSSIPDLFPRLSNKEERKGGGSWSNPSSPRLSWRSPFRRTKSGGGGHNDGSEAHLKPVIPHSRVGSTKLVDEPIYSEPLTPMASQIKAAEKTTLSRHSQSTENVRISSHIYDYLGSRRSDACTQIEIKSSHSQPLPPPLPGRLTPLQRNRQGSLMSASLSSNSSSSQSSSSRNLMGKKKKKKMCKKLPTCCMNCTFPIWTKLALLSSNKGNDISKCFMMLPNLSIKRRAKLSMY